MTMLLNLIEPTSILPVVISVILITFASQRASKMELSMTKNEETVYDLDVYHILCFPIIGSVMLLVFYYFFRYIQYFHMLLCIVVSLLALFNLSLHPISKFLLLFKRIVLLHICSPKVIAIFFSLSIVIGWILTDHWIYLDVIGMAICVLIIQYVRLPNLKLSTILLLGLMVYDIFWVFYSSSFFTVNVMLEVATKKADNPVAALAEKLNFPDYVKNRPLLSIPGKLVIPSYFGDYVALLGLGDIIIPGLVLSFSMKFDTSYRPGISNITWIRCCQKLTYYTTGILGYIIGLTFAQILSEIYNIPQPALLSLVPCVLLSLIFKAIIQGDFLVLWNGSFLFRSNIPSHLPM